MDALLERYPEHVETAIKNRNIILNTIPDGFKGIEDKNLLTKPIKDARQLHQHILAEKEFWTQNLVKNNKMVSQYPHHLNSALSSFDTLIKQDPSQTEAQLNAILKSLTTCQISSETKLAKTFVKYQKTSPQFITGFTDAITGNNSNANVANHPDWHKGLIIGYGYTGIIQNLSNMVKEEKEELAATATKVKKDIVELMARATAVRFNI